MELDVNTSEASVVDGVETVEVIAGGEDAVNLGSSSAAATLMDQHIAGVANPQEILVPTSEVQMEGQALDQALLAHGTPIITIPVGPPSPGATQQMLVGSKRSHPEVALTTESLMTTIGTGTTSVPIDSLPINTGAAASQPSPDVPRKKSRNYLDSHKTIEKKRRDRINSCLDQLKNLVPDCRQYGSKKLDKAEILEMSIEYIQRMQNSALGGKSTLGGLDINMSQREWANDLTTWVIQNKMVHTGPNALDGFCHSLLIHLQSMGSGNALASATSMLLNQASATAAAVSASEDDALFRQQTTVNTQVALLQQIQQQQQQQQQSAAVSGVTTTTTKDAAAGTEGGGGVVGGEVNGGGGGASAATTATVGGAGSSAGASSASQQTQTQQQLQQAQLTQLQALLLLQQQQQLLNQQQQQETDAQSQQTHLQQLQQLQQLQALLLQHIANEASSSNTSTTASGGSTAGTGSADSADSVGGGASGGESQIPTTSKSDGTQTTHALQVDDASSVLTGSNPMTGEGAGLSDDHPAVELSQPSEEELAETTEETVYTSAISQMWSSAGSAQANQGSSLLMLGGGSESEGEGVGGINGRPGGKSSLIETGEVQEEVELLSQQEH